jgi:hypothetical protein
MAEWRGRGKRQEIKITARELVVRGIDELVPGADNARIHGEER